MHSLALALLVAAAPAPAAPFEEPIEVPINVPSPIPVGFLVAWKPMILSLNISSGTASTFGSEKFQPFRFLGRYTSTWFSEKLLLRGEIEGGQFQSDTQNTSLGSNGYDVTVRLLGGTATKISPGFIITASAGLLSRYQRGRAVGGAPSIGLLGVTSNVEFEYRFAPLITFSLFFEGGLTPIPYAAESRLGLLSDASELRGRLQFSLDVSPKAAIDIGYDFTRWHLSFSESNALAPAGSADKALLIEAREQALTFGVRWKP